MCTHNFVLLLNIFPISIIVMLGETLSSSILHVVEVKEFHSGRPCMSQVVHPDREAGWKHAA